MVQALIFDFSRVLLFPKDETYAGTLNELHKNLSSQVGYKLLDHFYLNEELLSHIHSLKERVSSYMFTSETIQESPELLPMLGEIFNKVYSSLRINLSKNNPEAYRYIAKDIKVTPENIAFIDDSETNLKAAGAAGLQTIHYENNYQTIQAINNLLG